MTVAKHESIQSPVPIVQAGPVGDLRRTALTAVGGRPRLLLDIRLMCVFIDRMSAEDLAEWLDDDGHPTDPDGGSR